MGCRFPGAVDLAAFARLLFEGRSAIGDLPRSRFDTDRLFDPSVGAYAKSRCRIGACVDDREIDTAVLGLSREEAETADTIHLWVLEVAKATLEHAGLDPFSLRGRNVGVVLGHSRGSAQGGNLLFSAAIESLLPDLDTLPALAGLPPPRRRRIQEAVAAAVHGRYPVPATDRPMLFRSSEAAGIVARTFGLTGGHLITDAACASSLAAIDVAVRALRQGRLEMALAGGVSFTSPAALVLFSQAQALSPDGSFPFDARANGFVCSEGAGMVLLVRLEDAIARGHRILGVLHGIGASTDGRGKGLWAPNRKGQILAIEAAYARCGIDPASVGYIEAHGTSTALGDATEIESLTEFFGPRTGPGRRIAIGSVKSNIGHARESAGIASLLKVLLAFEHGTIPASINYERPNPDIHWDRTPLEIASASRPWPRGDGPRVAGIDSFGIGGLNWHVIVEEPPDQARAAQYAAAVPPADAAHAAAPADPVALVGLGCLWPGARGAERFWTLLEEGRSVIDTAPDARLPAAVYLAGAGGRRLPWRTYTNSAAFIADFTADWRRYRMPPKVVDRTDPLQLMLLECAMDALADAGIDPAAVDRRRVATAVGTVFGSDYGLTIELALRAQEAAEVLGEALAAEGLSGSEIEQAVDEAARLWRARLPEIDGDSAGNATSSPLASRIASTLDLHGETLAIDAGPSSSLAALEVACESLAAGHADIALWAGADRGLSAPRFLDAARIGCLSSTGRSAPFDAEADGVVLSEGVAIGVLMRLSDAQAAGRRIYAVIRGVGSSSPHPAPLPDAPRSEALGCAMRRAHDRAGVDLGALAHIESVGAGSPRADAAVAEAASAGLGTGSRATPLLLGSVAGNIGHAQGAAGAAAVLKTALALDRGTLPPTVGVTRKRASLGGLDVCTTSHPMPTAEAAHAAVSAWSERGVSYHVVLESAPRIAPIALEPVVFRAPDRRALDALLASAASHPDDFGPGSVHGAGAVAAGLRAGPGLAARLDAARKALAAPAPSVVLPGAAGCVTDFTLPGDTCFMFSGQGSQYAGMLRDVAAAYPEAAARLREVDAALVRCGQQALSAVLWERTERLDEVLWTQMAVLGGDLMMMEVARRHGLAPQLLTGHSYGDYAALVAAGAWSIDEVVRMTVLRCQGILQVDVPGGMVAVFSSRARVAELLAGVPGYAVESNINSPDEVIVSGEPGALDALLARCQAAGVTARRLPVPRAFHCELMRPALLVVAGALREIPFRTPSIPFMTSAGAAVISRPDDLRRALAEQFTQPVDFIAQIEAAYAAGCRRFVEIGPGKVLARLATRILTGRPAVVVSLDDKRTPGLDAIASAMAILRAHDHPRTSAAVAAEAAPVRSAPPAAGSVPQDQPAPALPVAGTLAAGEIRFADVTTRRRGPQRAAPQPPPRPPGARVPPSAPDTADVDSRRRQIETRIVDLVCDASGYPRDLVSLDSDLEADLGIDTVKQAQILGAVREHYDLPADDGLVIREVPTPRHIADYVERAGVLAGEPAAVPVTAAATGLRPDAPHEAIAHDAEPAPHAAPVPSPHAAAGHAGAASVRHVTRLDDRPLAASTSAPYQPARLVILGAGVLADAISAALADRGVTVACLALDDDPEALARGLDPWLAEDPLPDLCVLAGVARDAEPGWMKDGRMTSLPDRGARLLEGPFCAVQAWMRRLEAAGRLAPPSDAGESTARPALFAVTALGGGLGHTNAGESLPEGGGIIGFFKDLRREFPGLRVKVLDTERGEHPQTIVRALLAELDSVDDRLEVGLLRGRRLVPRLVPSAVRVSADRLEWLKGLPSMVLTGGGRGITAEIAVRLAARGVRRLHLLGRTPVPPDVERWSALDAAGLEALRHEVLDDLRSGRLPRRRTGGVSPAEWDEAWAPVTYAIDVHRNLRRIAEAGGDAVYHACDVTDPLALAATLDEIRRHDGPIRAIVHGAGIQVSRGFLSKPMAEMRATLAPKLRGAVNVIALTADDPLELFAAFGSVAGRFGGRGQADYSMACDLLARITGALAAARPSCRAVTIAWPAWDEVGMAAKVRHLFESLARGGRTRMLMPVEEGCRHFVDEIAAAHPESDVVIGAELDRLDADHQIPRGPEAERLDACRREAAVLPLVDAVLAAPPGAVTVECRLDADRDPFLLEHRHARTAIVPAVVSLELLAETARLAHAGARLDALEHVVIAAGVKLSEVRRLSLACTGTVSGDEVHLSVTGDHVGRHARLLALHRTHVTGIARLGPPTASRLRLDRDPDLDRLHIRRPPPHLKRDPLAPADWHHGPAFQTLETIAIGPRGLHVGRVRALPATALRPSGGGPAWWVPAPLLDGCLALCVDVVRATLAADGLPVAFGRLHITRQPEPHELCEVLVRERGHDDRRVHFDFLVTGLDGSVVLEVEDCVLHTRSRIRDTRGVSEALSEAASSASDSSRTS